MSGDAESVGDAKLNELMQQLRNDVADLESKVSKLQQDGDNSALVADTVADAVQRATELITGSTGGRVVTVLDEDGKPRELCILTDSDDISTAQSLWRWNEGGLGHSDTGYNGTFSLALTKDGAIVADRITAGTLNAGVIRAGILTDKEGKNRWDMGTGEFSISGTFTSYDGPGGNVAGRLGYMAGATTSGETDGIGVENSAGDCYVIVTSEGTRLQAGDYDIHVARTGGASIISNVGKLEFLNGGDKGAGVYLSGGAVYYRANAESDWAKIDLGDFASKSYVAQQIQTDIATAISALGISSGNWTPTVEGASKYTTREGHYVKIGNSIALISFAVYGTFAGSTTSRISITGCPVASANGHDAGGGGLSGYYSASNVVFTGWNINKAGTIYAVGQQTGTTGAKYDSTAIYQKSSGDFVASGTIMVQMA